MAVMEKTTDRFWALGFLGMFLKTEDIRNEMLQLLWYYLQSCYLANYAEPCKYLSWSCSLRRASGQPDQYTWYGSADQNSEND